MATTYETGFPSTPVHSSPRPTNAPTFDRLGAFAFHTGAGIDLREA